MKYVISWTPRRGGSAAENEASAARGLEITRNWTPPPGITIHQFVLRIDGQGGFAVADSDHPADIARDLLKFSGVDEYTVYPVIDFDEGVRVAGEAVEFLKSI
jgi:hypothetical protein